jgi:radical SAM family uncharacterized protein/radical SAM-linked protein
MQHLLEKKLFPFVSRPGRYIGGELGRIVKSPENKFKVALGYPDMYEVGMSNLGLQILYHIINRDDRFLCERFFAPDRDAEEILRRESIPYFSLESFRPLSQFDLVGFTLAYEMVYTNVLNILDLSGIPLRAVDRTDEHPIIAAGGPVVHNPEPTSAFFDFYYIGEVEEALIDILEILQQTEGLSRIKRLEQLVREIPSIYVPRFYDETTRSPLYDFVPEKVKSNKIGELKKDYYPSLRIIPFIETVHDRLSVEIMRGCPQGCRFCQATSIYRPVRLRPVDEIISQVNELAERTGYDEVSLLSLSSSDYPDIIPLTVQLARSLHKKQVALSLPSLRPGTFSQELADAVKATRKTGLTFAPEAGTERLRQIIRKDITDDELYETLRLVFENEWNLVKLYFMIGLPTETDDDVRGIVNMIHRADRIARQVKGKNIINVAVSPFSPKSHTPFQWDEQPSPETIRQKNDYIRRSIKSRFVNIKLRDPELSFLEGVIGRGGRELSGVIEAAFKSGARFDGWSEEFNFDLWIKAFTENQLDPFDYLKGIPFSARLPWSHIEVAQSAEYFQKERGRTSTMLTRSKLKESIIIPPEQQVTDDDSFGRSRKKVAGRAAVVPTRSKIRIRWGRKGLARFLSHLDNIRVIERAIRRSGIPAEYTQGFHPHLKLSFGPPLQLGYTSEAEYFDLLLGAPFHSAMADRLEGNFPDGFFIMEVRPIIDKKVSLSSQLNRAVYELLVENKDDCQLRIDDFLSRESVEIERVTKTEAKPVNIRPAVFRLQYREQSLIDPGSSSIYMELGVGSAGYARPSEVMLEAGLADEMALPALICHRRELLFIDENDGRVNPMEL